MIHVTNYPRQLKAAAQLKCQVDGVSCYLSEVVGCVEDVLLLAVEQSVDQLLDHTCLLVDDGQVQRTVGNKKHNIKC